MRDPKRVVREYFVSQIRALSLISNGQAVPVYNKVPKTANYPCIIIGEQSLTPDNDKTSRGFESSIRVEVVSRYDLNFGTDSDNDNLVDSLYQNFLNTPQPRINLGNNLYMISNNSVNDDTLEEDDDRYNYRRRIVNFTGSVYEFPQLALTSLSYDNTGQAVDAASPIVPMNPTVGFSGGDGQTPTYFFEATGLPSGINIDPLTGVISGSSTFVDTYLINVTVSIVSDPSAGTASAIIPLEILSTIPDAPTNLAAVAEVTGNRLTWEDNSTNELIFEVHRSTEDGFTPDINTILTTTAPDVEEYLDTTASSGVTYYYLVRAQNASGYSAFSNQASATTLITDNLWLDPVDSSSARIVGQGTNDTDGTIYSAKAIDLDGGTGFISSNQTPSIDVTDIKKIVLWVNVTEVTGSTQALLDTRDSNRPDFGFSITIRDTGIVAARYATDASNIHRYTTAIQPFTVGKWQKWVFTDDGSGTSGGCNLNIGGADYSFSDSLIIGTPSTITDSNSRITIGAAREGSVAFLNGQIAETTIDINGTRAHTWGFESGKEAVFFDSTTDIAATLNGGATWITGLSGFNYPVEVSKGLKGDLAGAYYYWDGVNNEYARFDNMLSAPSDFTLIVRLVLIDNGSSNYLLNGNIGGGFGIVITDDRVIVRFGSGLYTFLTNDYAFGQLETLTISRVGDQGTVSLGVNSFSETQTVDTGTVNYIYINSNNSRFEGVIVDIDFNGSILNLANNFGGVTFPANTPNLQQFPEIGLPQPANRNSNIGLFLKGTNQIELPDLGLTGASARVICGYVLTDSSFAQVVYSQGSGNERFQINFLSNGALRLDYGTGTGAFNYLTSLSINLNQIHFFAVRVNSGASTISDIDFFIDDAKESGVGSNAVTFGDYNYRISNDIFASSKWRGVLSDIRIYDTDLSDAEIEQVRQKTFADDTNLLARYPLIRPYIQNIGDGVITDIANGNNGTLKGTISNLPDAARPIPAKSTNPEEDIFNNAIVNSIFDAEGNQIAWNLQDDQSSADTNATETIDSDVGFEIGISNFLFTDTGALQVLLSNRNTSNNGLLIYITSDKKLVFRFQFDASNYIDFSTPALTKDTDYESAVLTYDGASGVTISVNGLSQSLTDNSLGSITGQTIPNDHSLQIGQDPDGDNKIQGLIGRITLKFT